MSFREKSAWICLLSTLLVFTPYFVHVWGLFQQGRPVIVAEIWLSFALAVVVQTVITVATHIALAWQAAREPEDERDTVIDSMARLQGWGGDALLALLQRGAAADLP